MAYSIKRYVGDGVNKNFALTFPYIAKTDIHVYVDGVEVSYTWFSDTVVTTTVAPGAGTVVSVERQTERASALVDFQDATVLKEASLDLNTTQLLYIAQEAFDYNEESLSLNLTGLWDALSKRIINVADPVNAQDAATRSWVISFTAAQVAACAASEAAAALSETNAAASESAAAVSAANSAASASASAASASASAASASASAASASAALASENKAHLWAEEAEDVPVDPGEYSSYHWAQKAMLASGGDTVKISANDTTADHLINKLTVSSGLVLTEQNDGANETLNTSVGPTLVVGAPPSVGGYELMVYDPTSESCMIHFTNLTSGTTIFDGFVVGLSAEEDAVIINRENTAMRLFTNNTERMRIDSGGNVGLGTSNPLQRLHLHGAFYAYVNFTTDAVGSTTTDGAYVGIGSSNDFYVVIRENAGIIFSTNSIERMSIKADGKVTIGGGLANRGLNLYGGTEAQLHLSTSETGNAWNDGMLLGVGGGGQVYIWDYEATAMVFGTSNTERMRILSTGEVGIGTTAPVRKLHMADSGVESCYIHFSNATSGHLSTQGWDIGVVSTGLGIVWGRGNYDFQLGTYNVERMRVTATGRVGIGETVPDGKLHISSGGGGNGVCDVFIESDTDNTNESANPRLIFVQDGGLQEGGIYLDDGNHFHMASGYGNIYFDTHTAASFDLAVTRMTVTTGGNVGIGAISPNHTLQMHKASAGTVYAQFTNTTTGSTASDGLLVGIDASGNGKLILYENTNLTFATNATTRMYLTGGGDLVMIEGASTVRTVWDNTPPSGWAQGGMPLLGGAASSGYDVNYLDVDAVIGAAWESVGPTGSGATNIWTPLNNVATDARAVRLRFYTEISGSTNGDTYRSTTYCRGGASSVAIDIANVASVAKIINRSGATESATTNSSDIYPIDPADRTFDLYHEVTGTTPSDGVRLYLGGWL